MMKNFGSIGAAINDSGNFHYQYVYKPSLVASGVAGYFIDANQSAGHPVYNAFAGSALTFTELIGQKNQGIFTGPVPGTDKSKYLSRIQILSTSASSPSYVYLNDYLGFYALIDGDNTDIQEMDNTLTLPRYVDGKGVQAVMIATAPMVQTAPCTVIYTNSEGVSGRSTTFSVIPAASIGVCATGSHPTLGTASQSTPFIPLADGDEGIRLIESITFAAGAGGFICIALVKPIANIQNYEVSVASEKQYGVQHQRLSKIEPGAYLNFLLQRGNTAAINFYAELIFINS